MTVTHKGADMLDDVEFDRLIAGKFPPMRRRSEPMDFEPTIAVDRPDHEDVQACSHCKGVCKTPDACGLPEPDPRMVRRFWGGYAVFLIVVGVLTYWRFG